jgi:hypothetical protein
VVGGESDGDQDNVLLSFLDKAGHGVGGLSAQPSGWADL